MLAVSMLNSLHASRKLHAFLSSDVFLKINAFDFFRITISVSNSLNPD